MVVAIMASILKMMIVFDLPDLTRQDPKFCPIMTPQIAAALKNRLLN